MTALPVTFRPCTPADALACLELFDGNCLPYFHPSERADYEQFLGNPEDRGDYWVMEQGGEVGGGGVVSGTVVGCGGVWVSPEGQGGLSWGMVRRDLQRRGLGTRLTAFRLERLRARPEVRRIRLGTSQHTEAFYALQGFVAVERAENGFAPGIDEVKMSLELGPGPV